MRMLRILTTALFWLAVMSTTVAASVTVPDSSHEGAIPQATIWDDALAPLLDVGLEPTQVEDVGLRLALPPGTSPDDLPLHEANPAAVPLETYTWRVDDGAPALSANLDPGPNHGIANRFDPADFWDTDEIPPRPLRIQRIYFWVSTNGEPSGPMEWHIWEDNGGHKPDPAKDIIAPFVVTGGPGQNVIDLEALGKDVVIDPARMFQVGVAHKLSEVGSPDILLDDGLPHVGDTGDFHSSLMYLDENCNIYTFGLLATDLQDGQGTRAPVWMIWLDVEWLPAPTTRYFDAIDGGDFAGASRIAWGDYDGDGPEDILANGSTLYRNTGDGAFADVTKAAGITDSGSGGLWADYDNDGDLDFYQYTSNCVPCGQDDNFDDLWRNDGDGTFTNVRDADYRGDAAAPIPRDPLPTEGAAWGDFNGDGYLDLYAANHVDWDSGACFDDYLWLNNGPPDYTFRDASQESGIRTVRLCGRGVNAADFDDDGDLDIFVSNYRLNRDLLWVNTGNSGGGEPQFVNQAGPRGVEGRRTPSGTSAVYGHSIGGTWGDIDRDGDTDLVSARLAHSAWLCFSDVTGIYESDGAGGGYNFTNRRVEAGIAYNEVHSDPSLVDFDNDGHLDLHITQVYDGWRSSTYRSLGTVPATFEDVTDVSGIWPRSGWGSGWSDFDGDGDLDLAARGLWRNRASADGTNNWLQVSATGCGLSNRDAVGAKVSITYGNVTDQREVVAARGTGSEDSRVQHFGLGDATSVNRVTVAFPAGQVHTLDSVAANQRVSFVETGAVIRASNWPQPVWVGRPVDLIADTCGATRQLAWDLDDDGEFDDGTDAVIGRTFDQTGSYPVAVRVSDGTTNVVMHATIDVVEYMPTPTPTSTPVPWPTPGPSPTIDRTHFVSIFLPRLDKGSIMVPAAPAIDPLSDPNGDGSYTVSWSSVEGAVLYLLQEDRDGTFADPIEAYKGGKTAVELTGRQAGGQYCYRVRALGTSRDGPWSDRRCFIE